MSCIGVVCGAVGLLVTFQVKSIAGTADGYGATPTEGEFRDGSQASNRLNRVEQEDGLATVDSRDWRYSPARIDREKEAPALNQSALGIRQVTKGSERV